MTSRLGWGEFSIAVNVNVAYIQTAAAFTCLEHPLVPTCLVKWFPTVSFDFQATQGHTISSLQYTTIGGLLRKLWAHKKKQSWTWRKQRRKHWTLKWRLHSCCRLWGMTLTLPLPQATAVKVTVTSIHHCTNPIPNTTLTRRVHSEIKLWLSAWILQRSSWANHPLDSTSYWYIVKCVLHVQVMCVLCPTRYAALKWTSWATDKSLTHSAVYNLHIELQSRSWALSAGEQTWVRD